MHIVIVRQIEQRMKVYKYSVKRNSMKLKQQI